MTPVEQRAASASAVLVIGEDFAIASMTFARAGVSRCGALPVATSPNLGAGASAASGARAAMRSTAPRGASVQRATQSMNSRNGALSGAQSRFAPIAFRFSPAPWRADHTTPVAMRVPSGAATKSPGTRSRCGGTR